MRAYWGAKMVRVGIKDSDLVSQDLINKISRKKLKYLKEKRKIEGEQNKNYSNKHGFV